MTAPQPPDQDPGWGSAKDLLLGAFVPRAAGARTDRSALLVMRTFVLTVALSLAAIAVVTLLLTSDGGGEASSPSVPLACAGVAVVGVLLVSGGQLIHRRLRCDDLRSLVESYRRRVFLRAACAQLSALVGFAVAFQTSSFWPYLVGAVVAWVGLFLVAPTRAHLAHVQEELTAQGCQHQLLAVLRDATMQGPTG